VPFIQSWCRFSAGHIVISVIISLEIIRASKVMTHPTLGRVTVLYSTVQASFTGRGGTHQRRSGEAGQAAYPDGVRPPYRCGARHLRGVLQDGLGKSSGPPLDDEAWGTAPYHPTPTIIEAARALYA
jgi:hypothetical protein